MIGSPGKYAVVAGLIIAFGLTACSGPGGAPPEAARRGVGTPGVSAYMPGVQPTSLQALLDRCRLVPQQEGSPSAIQGLPAACDQLHRQLHNQPGNTAAPDQSM